MKIYENLWKSMKIYENLWKSMKINKKLWKSMKIYENIRKYMSVNNDKNNMIPGLGSAQPHPDPPNTSDSSLPNKAWYSGMFSSYQMCGDVQGASNMSRFPWICPQDLVTWWWVCGNVHKTSTQFIHLWTCPVTCCLLWWHVQKPSHIGNVPKWAHRVQMGLNGPSGTQWGLVDPMGSNRLSVRTGGWSSLVRQL